MDAQSSKPVGICVVGCGQIARNQLDTRRQLPKKVRLVSVVDVDAARAHDAAEKYGALRGGLDYRDERQRDDRPC